MHWLDALYLRLTRRARLFTGGWGDPDRPLEHVAPLLTRSVPEPLRLEFLPTAARTEEAFVLTPAPLLPPEAARLHVTRLRAQGELAARLVVPPSWGDEGFRTRTRLLNDLRYRGVEVWLFEGAYFGSRRLEGQRGAAVRTVGDFLRMGLSNVLEARALVMTALEARPRAPVVLAGYSMAGQMAGHAAASLDAEVPVVAMAPPNEASVVFCDGPLSEGVEWGALGDGAKERLRRALQQLRVSDQPPPWSSRRVVVAPRFDGIVAPSSMEQVARHWGVTPRWVASGHLGAYALHGRELRAAILGAVR
jgi:hypothetical protein